MKCPLAVMKSDMWRYCIMYKCGGVYAVAMKMNLIGFLPPRRKEHLCVHDNFRFNGKKNMVEHLFTGQEPDEWCNKRLKYLQ